MAGNTLLQTTLQWTIWALAMSLVMGLLAKSRDKPRPASDADTLQHARAILVLGQVSVLFFVIMAIISAATMHGKDRWMPLPFLGFALLCGTLILEYRRARHQLTDDGLAYGTLFRGRHVLRWKDVRRISYSPAMKWFVITSPDRPPARISTLLQGLPEFANAVLQQVPHGSIEPETLKMLGDTANGELPRLWQ